MRGLKETGKPGATPQLRRPRPGDLQGLRTQSLPGAGPIPPHPALRPKTRSRSRTTSYRRDQDAGPQAHPRYGYKRITALLKRSGWKLNRKRVLRIWRAGGTEGPDPEAPRSRASGFENGRSTRLIAERRNHVWAYDFTYERTEDGKPLRILTVVDEFTRVALSRPGGPIVPCRGRDRDNRGPHAHPRGPRAHPL